MQSGIRITRDTTNRSTKKRHQTTSSSTSPTKNKKWRGPLETLSTTTSWPGEQDPRTCYHHESLQDLQNRADIDEFVELNSTEIRKLIRCITEDRVINSLFSNVMKLILSGPIKFVFPYGPEISESNQKALSNIWTLFITDFYKYTLSTGFAAVVWIEHPELKGIPVALDLSQLQIKYHRSITGQNAFLYRKRVTKQNNPNLHEEKEAAYIPGVMTFIDSIYAPGHDGTLNSRVKLCVHDMKEYTARKELRAAAESKAVFNSVYIESPETKESDFMANDAVSRERMERQVQIVHQLNSRLALLQNALGPTARTSGSALPSLAPRPILQEQYTNILEGSRLPSDIQHSITRARILEDARTVAAEIVPAAKDLRPGAKATFAPVPYIPQGIENEDDRRYGEYAGVFELPPAVVRPMVSSLEYLTEVRNHLMGQTQQKWQERAESVMEAVFTAILWNTHPGDYVTNPRNYRIDARKETDHSIARKITTVNVQLERNPTHSQMEQLFRMGVLKPEGYIHYLTTSFSLDPKHLNTTPRPPCVEYSDHLKAIETTMAAANDGDSDGDDSDNSSSRSDRKRNRASKKLDKVTDDRTEKHAHDVEYEHKKKKDKASKQKVSATASSSRANASVSSPPPTPTPIADWNADDTSDNTSSHFSSSASSSSSSSVQQPELLYDFSDEDSIPTPPLQTFEGAEEEERAIEEFEEHTIDYFTPNYNNQAPTDQTDFDTDDHEF